MPSWRWSCWRSSAGLRPGAVPAHRPSPARWIQRHGTAGPARPLAAGAGRRVASGAVAFSAGRWPALAARTAPRAGRCGRAGRRGRRRGQIAPWSSTAPRSGTCSTVAGRVRSPCCRASTRPARGAQVAVPEAPALSSTPPWSASPVATWTTSPVTLLAAESVGAAWCPDTRAEYAKVREQFGVRSASSRRSSTAAPTCCRPSSRPWRRGGRRPGGGTRAPRTRWPQPVAGRAGAPEALRPAAGTPSRSSAVSAHLGARRPPVPAVDGARALDRWRHRGPPVAERPPPGPAAPHGRAARGGRRVSRRGPPLVVEVQAAPADRVDRPHGRTPATLSRTGLPPWDGAPPGRAARHHRRGVRHRGGCAAPSPGRRRVLPTLIAHGSPAQQASAGSPGPPGRDLVVPDVQRAGRRRRTSPRSRPAERTDGGWLLTGQKVWTTLAHQADFAICLARTLARTSPSTTASPASSWTWPTASTSVAARADRPRDVQRGVPRRVFVPDDWRWAVWTTAGRRPHHPENERVLDGQRLVVRPGGRERAAPRPAGSNSRWTGPSPARSADGFGALVAEGQSLAVLGLRTTLRGPDRRRARPGVQRRKLLGVEHEQRVQEAAWPTRPAPRAGATARPADRRLPRQPLPHHRRRHQRGAAQRHRRAPARPPQTPEPTRRREPDGHHRDRQGPLDTSRLGPDVDARARLRAQPGDPPEPPGVLGRGGRSRDAVAKLRQLKDAGIDTIVDPDRSGLGRQKPRVQEIAAQIDLNIVAGRHWALHLATTCPSSG